MKNLSSKNNTKIFWSIPYKRLNFEYFYLTLQISASSHPYSFDIVQLLM